MGDEEVMSASDEGIATAGGYAPHPFIGGRTAALRALAAWRMSWPGAPRVIALTGDPGSGRGRLLTGFLMLCDPEYRKQLPLDDLDPATVPPDLPAPAVPDPERLTSAQLLWTLADHFGLRATRTEDIFTELAAREEQVTIVVPDIATAGPVRAANEPARLLQDVLKPLAATPTVQLLAVVERESAAELAASLPGGQAQIIDLDAPEWADPEGLVLHAETALDTAAGAPELPFTTDPELRGTLAAALAARAGGNRLTVQLAVQSLLMQPEGFDPADTERLPGTLGQVLDLHAARLGADPQTLRLMLAPLAFAEGDGLPVQLWGPLANAVAEQDLSQAIADGMLLAAPFVQLPDAPDDDGTSDGTNGGAPADDGTDGTPAPRPLIRLAHPALAAEVRAGLPDPRGAQTRIAMALLEAVPDQDWSKADPYIRDHIAGHTLDAGLLPQLLTDPGLFAHADPVTLRAAVEAVPLEALGAPARTYLRTAPLLTRSEAPVSMRAAFLESAFVEDGLLPYAQALHGLGLDLPWRTLWSLPLTGATGVTLGTLAPAAAPGTADGPDGPSGDGGAAPALPVALVVVPAGTPGSRPVPGGDTTALLVHELATAAYLDTDPAQVVSPSDEERAAGRHGLSRSADYLRVWSRTDREVVAALISDTPITGADLSPDGILVVATHRGVTARQIVTAQPARPTVPAQAAGPADVPASPGLEGDHS
ncbi:ATP-binding protein [Streptomyces sp. NPDC050161]|uniref:ATP-binding protein n=1 Tax=Streptomyces sp. NPDC050161 TaxID=3365604 RepID=UPI0037BC588E